MREEVRSEKGWRRRNGVDKRGRNEHSEGPLPCQKDTFTQTRENGYRSKILKLTTHTAPPGLFQASDVEATTRPNPYWSHIEVWCHKVRYTGLEGGVLRGPRILRRHQNF